MLVGNDISYAQGKIDWDTYSKNTDFVLIKAGEGTNLIDSWFGNNRQQARDHNVLRGFYWFVRPDLGNSPIDEAQFFLKLLNGQPLQEGEVLALDFEVEYSDPVAWCKSFLDYVYGKTGVKPLVYLDQSRAGIYDWSSVIDAGYGLWIADYTYDPNVYNASIGKWPFAAMQQWENNEQVPGINGYVDADEFSGDADAFKKYGYHAPIQTVQVPVSTNQGSTIVNVDTQAPTVPKMTQNQQTASPSANLGPQKAPAKLPWRWSDLIVWILTNIINVLKKYGK